MKALSEPPVIVLLRSSLDPAVCVLTLVVSMQAFDSPWDAYHLVLLVLSLFLSAWVSQALRPFRAFREYNLTVYGLAVLIGSLFVVASIYLLVLNSQLSAHYSEDMLVVWLFTLPVVALASHGAMYAWLHYSYAQTRVRKSIIVGATELALLLGNEIERDPSLLMRLHGYFEDRDLSRINPECRSKVLGAVADVPAYVKQHGIHVILITLPIKSEDRITRLLDALRDTTASVYFVPDIFIFDLINSRVDSIHNIPVVSVLETPIANLQAIYKRIFDVVFASAALLMLMPVLAAIAVGVKLSSPGPVLFAQRRYGLDGKCIQVHKFRTMSVCEDGPEVRQAMRQDPRITPFGGFLRKTSLDELPQFVDVLRGDMSVVGPRPHAIAHNEEYRKLIHGYMLRHKVRPGITGWAQVHGLRGETETLDKMQARVEYDLEYLRNWSLLLDIWIIVRTVGTVLKGHNAH